jgi:hypothetical protein
MKQITNFSVALDYVNHLGFAGGGNIAGRQYNLCHVTDALFNAAGAYPYQVCFKRDEHHPKFPFLGEFTVVGSKGKLRVRP